MPTAKAHALEILAKFEQAQTDFIGKCVILTDGKAGTVEKVWLDEFHGLRISIAGQRQVARLDHENLLNDSRS